MRKILLPLMICLIASTVGAQIYVVPTSSGQQNGTSWADGFTDLQQAIYSANAGDTIWVAYGSYTPSIDTLGALPAMPERRAFWLKNGVVIYGGFAGTETSLSQRDPVYNKAVLEGELSTGIHAEHVINVYSSIDSTAVLDGFVVQHGKSTVNSTEKNGSGMLLQGDAHFRNILFRNNETYHQGGAVYAVYSSSRFVACTFTDNKTMLYDGGAANIVYSDVEMYNCVFFVNQATRFGGAITTVESDLLIQNGTFAGNTGGSNVFQFSTSGTISLNNCIFTADNTAPAVVGTSGGTALFRECLMPQDNNWLVLCPTCWGGAATFGNASAGDFSLVAGSEGIDENLTVTPTNDYLDVVGNPRTVGASMDLGAYEFQGGVGVHTPLATIRLAAYPNPASTSLRLLSDSPVRAASIYNLAGQCLQVESTAAFSVAQLPAGVYVLRVETEGGIAVARFVKE